MLLYHNKLWIESLRYEKLFVLFILVFVCGGVATRELPLQLQQFVGVIHESPDPMFEAQYSGLKNVKNICTQDIAFLMKHPYSNILEQMSQE